LLRPLYDLIRAHVFAGERVHGDETPVPVLAKGQTATGRAWVYVRDDAPFGGRDPPAAVFFYSRDRAGEHAEAHLSVRKSRNDARARPGQARRQAKGRAQGSVSAQEAASGRDNRRSPTGRCPDRVVRRKWWTTSAASVRNRFTGHPFRGMVVLRSQGLVFRSNRPSGFDDVAGRVRNRLESDCAPRGS
jgi:hypothetical protein